MKTNELSIDRPPRAPRPPKATRHWQVRITDAQTVVVFGRQPDAPSVTVPRLMTSEELDALRHAVVGGVAPPTTPEAVAAILADPQWQTARLAYDRQCAPAEWKEQVGVTD